MSAVYNPEADVMETIERLELEARDVHRRMDWTRSDEDRRVLNKQLDELKTEITRLQAKLP